MEVNARGYAAVDQLPTAAGRRIPSFVQRDRFRVARHSGSNHQGCRRTRIPHLIGGKRYSQLGFSPSFTGGETHNLHQGQRSLEIRGSTRCE